MRRATNDVAIAVPPERAPVLIASYLSDSTSLPKVLVEAQAAIGRIIARRFRAGAA